MTTPPLRKETNMNQWQYLLLAAGALVLFLAIRSVVLARSERKQRDFTRSLETLLQPKETNKVICPQKRGRYILTSHRLILERKGKFHAVTLKKILKVQGTNREGNRTTVPAKMVTLTVKAEKEYVIRNTGPEFEELARQLTAVIKKQNEKKKGKTNEKK